MAEYIACFGSKKDRFRRSPASITDTFTAPSKALLLDKIHSLARDKNLIINWINKRTTTDNGQVKEISIFNRFAHLDKKGNVVESKLLFDIKKNRYVYNYLSYLRRFKDYLGYLAWRIRVYPSSVALHKLSQKEKVLFKRGLLSEAADINNSRTPALILQLRKDAGMRSLTIHLRKYPTISNGGDGCGCIICELKKLERILTYKSNVVSEQIRLLHTNPSAILKYVRIEKYILPSNEWTKFVSTTIAEELEKKRATLAELHYQIDEAIKRRRKLEGMLQLKYFSNEKS